MLKSRKKKNYNNICSLFFTFTRAISDAIKKNSLSKIMQNPVFLTVFKPQPDGFCVQNNLWKPNKLYKLILMVRFLLYFCLFSYQDYERLMKVTIILRIKYVYYMYVCMCCVYLSTWLIQRLRNHGLCKFSCVTSFHFHSWTI